ncbi:uncharacterized protein LOC143539586 [Bidens hawaiensis]|uniref:uncharacterized protein LOC143539586 n=1 Tax=Bidens hawaiensis TaxID=980011 RepID=UPI00404AC84D
MSSSSKKRKSIPSTSKINNHDSNGNLPRKPLSNVSNTPQPTNVQSVHVNPPNTCSNNRTYTPSEVQSGYLSKSYKGKENLYPYTLPTVNNNSLYNKRCVTSSNINTNPILSNSASVSTYINSGSTSSTRRKGRPRRTTNTTPIPMQPLNDFEFVVDVFKGISSDYLDLGNQTFQCDSCKACLWEAKSRRGKHSSADSNFSLCCRNGNVQLPELKQPHESYVKLFRGEDHLSNQLSSDAKKFDDYIINYLKEMLDSQNPLVQAYQMVRDSFKENPHNDLKLRIVGTRQYDARTYNLPTASEVAALIVGDIGDALDNRDIIVNLRSGGLRRISELHPSYTPLQFPLLYPFGEDGYKIDIPHRNVDPSSTAARKKCTMREFFAYRLQDRPNEFSLPLNGRRFFQQLLVDKYTMVESQRLHFIRSKQSELRCDTYESLRNLKISGTSDVSTSGQCVILPSSFTGGSIYMMQNYLDAMCLCRWYGYPDFFLTNTCNPGWPEVKRFLKDTSLNSEDRPAILCRIFKMKLDSMIKLLKDKSLFGKVKAAVYTIEFQKRGLPHAHICLFIHPDNKIHNPSDIDNFVSSEIPDNFTEPDLYQLVSDHMLHGPCGEANPSCSCMIDRECSKNFPKRFQNNRSVVPYNKILLRKYQAYINVEWCNQEGSIKYLFKYINKGPDRATISLVQNNSPDNEDPNADEIKAFYNCRYLSACEAVWRIFAFDVHYRVPAVTRLPFHLPGQQQVIYGPEEDIEDVLTKPSNAASMFIDWMEANKNYRHARKLSYAEFPTQFVWKKIAPPKWVPRVKGFAIGRIHAVPASFDKAYYLRILLNKVKRPQCFEDIRTVYGVVCDSFSDACYRRGLLDDDKEYIEAIEEASHTANGYYLRNLFATMLITFSLSRPDYVWDNTCDDQLKNLALLEIEEFLVSNNSSLRRFSHMPFPDQESISASMNPLMMEELAYDTDALTNDFKHLYISLTSEQKGVYNEIFDSWKRKKGGVFFVYGYGEGGRTAHSRFLVPINLTEDSQCQVKGNTDVSDLLKKTSLIIWDEAPMIHQHAFEALDRTLKDVMKGDLANTSESLFGGKVVVLGGDFRQILHVVQNGTRNECVNATISSSYIWSKCKVLKLTKNMRLTVGSQMTNTLEIQKFAYWLLDIGEGNLGGPNDGEATISIPDDLLIKHSLNPMSDLIDFVYPSMLERFNDLSYFQERVLLAPLNEVVQ